MMLDLGGALVRARDILGVFDLDNTTVMRDSREYLSAAEKGRITPSSRLRSSS